MAHIRQNIRSRIVTLLNEVSSLNSKVFASRIYTLEESNLPCACIYTQEESSEILTISPPRTVEKNLELNIEVYVKSENFTSEMEPLLKDIKEKLASDTTLNNLAKDSYLESQILNYNNEGDKNIATATLTFVVCYHHTEGTLN
jgi:hypothetical protein